MRPTVAVLALVAVGASAATAPLADAARSAAPAGRTTNDVIVTTTADAGAGSLRAAIELVNAGTIPHPVIRFAIPGAGPHTIAPLTELPGIAHSVVIDGYTQAGSAVATADAPATLGIAIDGADVQTVLDLRADDSVVRGLRIENVGGSLAGTSSVAIRLAGDRNRVTGTHIGATGGGVEATTSGVSIGGDDAIVGGTTPADRNVIAAQEYGVRLTGGTGTRVTGNYLCTDQSGTGRPVADTAKWRGRSGGISSDGAPVTVGGNAAGEGNVIACITGVRLTGVHGAVVHGNLIGVDATGTRALAIEQGVLIEGGGANLVGGTVPGEGNVIASAEIFALAIESDVVAGDSTGNLIQGNLVGTDASGEVGLATGTLAGVPMPAIWLQGDENVIGGTAPGAGNVIASAAGEGIAIVGDGNLVDGNWIGTDRASLLDLGNGGSGIRIQGDGNAVGVAAPNAIACNGGDGVSVVAPFQGKRSTDNPIVRNLSWLNGDLPIDLEDDGPTPNDPSPDPDTGSNRLQNTPVMLRGHGATASWELDSAPLTTYRIDFYDYAACTGGGVDTAYLGHVTARTDASGHAAGSTPLPAFEATAPVPPTPDPELWRRVVTTATVQELVTPPFGLSYAALTDTSEYSYYFFD